mmetsp:Transcript_60791/g.162546  ORF Transcript_60791/g.162546 Transcript_60791/m.162546 type:complete len:222 (+) Transcript_60791:2023-2688(+)
MDTKLSSMMTTSDAFLATSVPWMPMAKPTSAFLRAGASLVPSPVTATVWRTPLSAIDSWMPETSTCLSSGVDRASTRRAGHTLSNASCTMLPLASHTRSRKVLPSMTDSGGSSGVTMPHFLAMARAVWMLSPVTMRTTMPARLQSRMAPGTSSRRGSSMPTRQTRVRSFSMAFMSSMSMPAERILREMQMVRRPSSAKSEMAFSTAWRAVASSGFTSPSLV